tara:strand:- start:2647 stop:3030 length:384 start_codon:yes stop_codon:yes gene_type:complete
MSKHYVSNDVVRGDLVNLINNLDLKKKWIIEIKRQTKKRSTGQNSWLWACHKVVAEDTGNSVDDIHEIVKKELLPKKYVEFDGEEIEINGSTTGLTSNQWSEFMTEYSAWAAQYGIMLPHPEDQGRD